MIPCASPLAQYGSHSDEILRAVRRVLDSGNYILGPEVEHFEKSFATFCGVNHAVGVASGTDALILSLRALGVEPGDEVITVSHTALATVAAVLAVGATPVLVDIEPRHYTMDPAALRGAISSKCKAVIPVHLYGQCADLDGVMAVARDYGLSVIEDCAQATGALYKGRRVGSIGDVGCFSFYPTKNLGGIGDGGMVVARDAAVAECIRRLRQYGWDEQRATEEPGTNSRLDEVQAAILNVKLKTLDEDNGRRRRIARLYDEGLAGLPVSTPAVRPETDHVYHLYVAAAKDRDVVKKALADAGIFAGIHYPVPAHRHCGYDKRCRLPTGGLPVTDHVVGAILSLPMYPELGTAQAERVVETIRKR